MPGCIKYFRKRFHTDGSGVRISATDTTPDNFSFANQNGVARSTTIDSNTITITGIDLSTPVSVTGGTVMIAGNGNWVTSGVIKNNQTIQARVTSSSNSLGIVNCVVTIGGVSTTFTVTSIANTLPNTLDFGNIQDVALSTVSTSGVSTITGIDVGVSLTVSNGTISINGGAYTTSATAYNGNTISMRVTSSPLAYTDQQGQVFANGLLFATYTVWTLHMSGSIDLPLGSTTVTTRTAGIYNIPPGVHTFSVDMAGAGGSGGAGNSTYYGGGGGSGASRFVTFTSVGIGTQYACVVGAGVSGSKGGDTTFGTQQQIGGGYAGNNAASNAGGTRGSPGQVLSGTGSSVVGLYGATGNNLAGSGAGGLGVTASGASIISGKGGDGTKTTTRNAGGNGHIRISWNI